MLTEHGARIAPPKTKPYTLSDYAGLYLLVRPSGTKSWRLKYRLDHVEQCISFGRYPGVSLAIARRERDQVRVQLESGIGEHQTKLLAR
jgi:Arm DNA-binding domain